MDNHADLQDIYNETDANAAVETEENAAIVENTAIESDEAAADTATEDETADENVEDTEEESGESDADASAVSTDGTESEDDGYHDLLEDIPSDETLAAKLTRTPQPVKDLAFELRNGWQAEKAITASIGGEQGAQVLKPLADMMGKPAEQITSEDAAIAIGNLAVTNGPAVTRMLAEGAKNLLFNTETGPLWDEARKIGDKVLEDRGWPNAATIDKLALLIKNGAIDPDDEFEALRFNGSDTNVFKALQTEKQDLQTKVAELQNLVDNPHLIEAQGQQTQNAVNDMDEDLKTRIEEGIKPFTERFRWDATPRLTRNTVNAIIAELKNSPEYKDVKAFIRQYGAYKNADGSLPYPLQGKIVTLVNRAKGKFGEEASETNKELRSRSASSPSAKVQEKIEKETKPKAAPINTSNFYGGSVDIEPGLAEIYKETDAMIRAL